MVVTADTPADRAGVIWSHEFGHLCGLQHRAQSERYSLMHPVPDVNSTKLSFDEALAMHHGPLGAASPAAAAARSLPANEICSCQAGKPTNEIPWSESVESVLSEAGAQGGGYPQIWSQLSDRQDEVKALLKDESKKSLWPAALAVLGSDGSRETVAWITNYITSLKGSATPVHNTRAAALYSLGIALNRNRDDRLTEYLAKRARPEEWLELNRRVTFLPEEEDRRVEAATDLATVSAMALGISGTPSARKALEQLQPHATGTSMSAIGQDPIREFLDLNLKVQKKGLESYFEGK